MPCVRNNSNFRRRRNWFAMARRAVQISRMWHVPAGRVIRARTRGAEFSISPRYATFDKKKAEGGLTARNCC